MKMRPIGALSVSVLSGLYLLVAGMSRAEAQVSITTYHNDNSRTGQNLNETVLTPINVNQSNFGQLFALPVDGYVYGQPLYLPQVSINGGTHNVLYVVTENDSVYAFDADTSQTPLWQVSFINASAGITTVPPSSIGPNATDIGPQVGITSTPVIDPSSGTIYVVAATEENGAFVQRLHALDVSSGAEKFGGPVVISAAVPGSAEDAVNGQVVFNPQLNNQRAALLLSHGVIYLAWASYHDTEPYHGWVMAYSASTLAQLGALNITPNGSEGGIWQGGGGLVADANGNVYLATGNGTFDANTGGGDYGEGILHLVLSSSGLSVTDYFTPVNYASLNEADRDLGSGGPLLLPTQSGPYPNLLVHAGKQGNLYVVNANNLSGFNPNGDTVVQEISGPLNPIFGDPTYFNNNLYYWPSSDEPMMFSVSSGVLSSTWVARASSNDYSAYPGATMAVSANGSSNGIIWGVQTDGYSTGGPAILHAFNPPDLSEIYNSNLNPTRDAPGPAVKFVVPTIANGKVYVGTQTGVSVYGLFNGPGPAVSLTPDSVNFSNQTIGHTSAPQTVTLTYQGSGSLNIASITTSGPFAETSNCVPPLAPNAQCTISVTMNPGAAGALTGSLSIADSDSAASGTQAATLYGNGVTTSGPVISLSSSSLAFGNETPGTTSNLQNIAISNPGTAPLELNSLTISAPFQLVYYPNTPLELNPGESTQVSIDFAPATAASFTGTFTVASNAASGSGTATLTGTGGSGSNVQISVSPVSLSFGSQTVNTISASQNVTISNSGSSGSLTVTGFGIAAPFTLTSVPAVPFTLSSGQSAQVSVAFAPAATGSLGGTLTVNSNATSGASPVALSGTGTASAGPSVTLSPASLSFGSQTVGQASAPQSLVLTYKGSSTLTIGSIVASGNFAQTNNCTALAPNGQCTIGVTFTPGTSGTLTGTLMVTDSDSGGAGTQSAALSGSGASASGASISISPASLAFGTESPGSVSSYQSIAITNTSSVYYLDVSGISITAPFQMIYYPSTPVTLGPGETTHVTMAFAPTTSGNFNGTFTVNSNASSGSGGAALSGNTGSSTVQMGVSPATLNFASQTVNSTSSPQTVTITNSGSSGSLAVSGFSIAAPFTLVSAPGLPLTLSAGQSAPVSVAFSPTATGTFSGTLTVNSNATAGSSAVALSGTGGAATVQIGVSPASLGFASQTVNTTSASQTVTVSNAGSSGSLNVTGFSIAAPFNLTSAPAVPFTLSAGQSAQLSVAFAPTASGTFGGALTVNSNASLGNSAAALSGTGTASASQLSVSPASLSFGTQAVGGDSSFQTLAITNNSATNYVTLTGLSLSAPFEMIYYPATPLTLGPGETTHVTMDFAPTATGTVNGIFTVNNNAGSGPVMVTLGGTGQ